MVADLSSHEEGRIFFVDSIRTFMTRDRPSGIQSLQGDQLYDIAIADPNGVVRSNGVGLRPQDIANIWNGYRNGYYLFVAENKNSSSTGAVMTGGIR